MSAREKERFVFFTYRPAKARPQPVKHKELKEPEYPQYPEYPEDSEFLHEPEFPEESKCREEPECPEYPEYPEHPEEPECPEHPEHPEHPECPEEPCPPNAVMHVIKPGDTFWKLARKYDTTVEAIEEANPDVDPLNLQIGETLCIPQGVPGAKG